MSLDAVIIVSSDPRVELGSKSLMHSGITRSVQLYRSGTECLNAIADESSAESAVVVVDSEISDISPLNLTDAIRTIRPDVDVILAVAQSNESLIERAMLAGARAAVFRNCSDQDLMLVIQRVINARTSSLKPSLPGHDIETAGEGAATAVIGARGGAGRSTLSALLAFAASRSDVDTALVDFDLQFGDLSFLYGSNQGPMLYDLLQSLDQGGASCRGFGRELTKNLTLYAPESAPEKADLMAGFVRKTMHALKHEHDFVVLNTGAFWTLFHAELLDVCDMNVCVFDQSAVGARSTGALLNLCTRLGVPASKILCVLNRYSREGLSPNEMCAALGVKMVRTIPDGGRETMLQLESGSFDQLFEHPNEVSAAVSLVLDDIAALTGLAINSVTHMRSTMRRGSRFWRRA